MLKDVEEELSESVFHGTPQKNLTKISANHSNKQFDNATSVFGAFFTPDRKDAERYAGKSGSIHTTNLELKNPYKMPWREFAYYQDVTKDSSGKSLPPKMWEERLQELKSEAMRHRIQLEQKGHDGIVVLKNSGEIYEIASFNDVNIS